MKIFYSLQLSSSRKMYSQLAQALTTFDPYNYPLSVPNEFLDYIDIVREMVRYLNLYQTCRGLHLLL